MSIVEEIGSIGVTPAERRPVRALALVGLSRAVLGVLVAGTVWAASVTWSAATGAASTGRPLVVSPTPGVAAGTSVSGMLDDVRSRVERQGGTLGELDMARRDGRSAAVRLAVDLPGTGAAAVERLVTSLAGSALDEVSPRSVDPVPSGLRVRIDATVELAAAPPTRSQADGRPAAVALAQAAERSGVAIRGVEVPARPQDPARLVASGGLRELVQLVDIVERELSAPLRFRSVSVRRPASTEHEAVLTFGLREDGDRIGVEAGR